MLGKKAQVTLFIIAGIVILLIIGLVIVIYNRYFSVAPAEQQQPASMQGDVAAVNKFVQDCIAQVAVPGIFLLGLQGGYIYLPAKYLDFDGSYIAYSYYTGENIAPSATYVASQISTYMEESLPKCTGNFESFSKQNLRIRPAEPDAMTTVGRDNVVIKINYPLTLERDGASAAVSGFYYVIPVRLGYVLSVASTIITMEQDDPDWIDMSLLAGFDLNVDLVPVNSSDFVFAVTDAESMVQENPFIYLFAAKYRVNMAPQLLVNDTLYVKHDQLFNYTIPYADDDTIMQFEDNTAMFDIRQDGRIIFMPYVTGSFPVTIKITDPHRKYDRKTVMFVIK